MKRIFTIILSSVLVSVAHAQLLRNDFMEGIAIGSPIEKSEYTVENNKQIQRNQWNRGFRASDLKGSSPVATAALSYAGYPESGRTCAIKLEQPEAGSRLTCYSLFAGKNSQNSTGSLYLAFLINVGKVTANNGVGVIMLDGSHSANFQKTTLYVKKLKAKNTFTFGIGQSDSSDFTKSNPVFSDETFHTGTTYLLVLKHDCDTDRFSLTVNPALTPEEPEPLLAGTHQGSSSSLSEKGLRAITVRQRTNYTAQIGGLRLAKTWKEAIGVE